MRALFPIKTQFVAIILILACAVSRAETAAELIAQGDIHDEKFKPAEALKYYLPAEKMEPKNVELLLRIARQYRHLMQDSNKSDEKVRMGNTAMSYAERAVKLAPNESEAHLSVAISDAKMVPILGNKQRLEASKHLKAEVDKAIALDPKDDLAWHVLGCWHQRLSEVNVVMRTMAKLIYGGLPPATNDDAVKCFQQAIKLNPDRLIHYIELGRTYAQMGQPDIARKYIKKGLAMPVTGKDDPEIKQRGRETMAKL